MSLSVATNHKTKEEDNYSIHPLTFSSKKVGRRWTKPALDKRLVNFSTSSASITRTPRGPVGQIPILRC